MLEDKNNSLDKYNYQPVCRAGDFFENLAEQERLELEKYPSLPSLFSLMLNKVYSNFLKFIENIIGVKLYTSIQDFPFLEYFPENEKISG